MPTTKKVEQASSTLDIPTQLNQLQAGQPITLPLSQDEIGGELLNILSKGLYTNPLDAIREYVQNSIDANADAVKIQVTGNSVFIYDNGDGMDQGQLLQARQFGVSTKSIEENVGFRGIGIYSGFDLCNRLVIRTKKVDEKVEHFLVFKFGEMRKKLDAIRQDPARPAISLTKLLSTSIDYSFAPSSRKGESFTLVQLEELSDNHIHKLSDVEEVRTYILRDLPVKFSKNFEYGEEIEKALLKNVPGYKAARVTLQVENSKPIIVEKPSVPELDSPQKDFIYDSAGKPLANYWACLTSTSEAISSRAGYKDFAGLVRKIKGFTIGDRNYLSTHFTRRQMYLWWTGEVYVITTEVIPTSARDDFEASLARDALDAAVKTVMRSLQRIALDAQATRRADQIIGKSEETIKAVRMQIRSGDFDAFEIHHTISNTLEALDSQKNKASDKQKAKRLIKEAQDIRKRVTTELDEPTPVAIRKRKGVKSALEENNLQLPLVSAKDVHAPELAPSPASLLNLIKES